MSRAGTEILAPPTVVRGRRRTDALVRAGRLVILLGLLGAWEILTRGVVNPLFLAPPTAIVERLVAMRADILKHTAVTLQEVILGFAIAAFWGVVGGFLLALNRTLERIVEPFVTAFYAVPIIAIAPLLILIFGLGSPSKIATAAIYAGFPIIINVIAGVSHVDETLIKAVRSFGATRRQIITKVILPGSMPSVIAGLRLGFIMALIAVIVSQMLAGYAGLGWLVAYAAGTFRTPDLYAGLVLLAAVGIAANGLLRRLEGWLMGWHEQQMR